MGYPTRGIACAINIPKHEQCPFDSINQNNLLVVFIEYPKQLGSTFLIGFGRLMQYPSKFQKICYGAQCIYGVPYERYFMCIK